MGTTGSENGPRQRRGPEGSPVPEKEGKVARTCSDRMIKGSEKQRALDDFPKSSCSKSCIRHEDLLETKE